MSELRINQQEHSLNPVTSFDTVADLKACTKLKEGMVVMTKGYYFEGDGGKSTYRICNITSDSGGGTLELQGDLCAYLMAQTVNYKQFGAIGDGVNDDGVQIKATHDYANRNNIPVVNTHGEYRIKSVREIEIRTDTSLGKTKIHIDEKYNVPYTPVFIISSNHPCISLDPAILPPDQIKRGTTFCPALANYPDHLVIVEDSNTKIAKRSGLQSGWSMSEFFVVEEHGKLIGDIAWTFHTMTSITAYPLDKDYLTVQGGHFYVNGQNSLEDLNHYTYSGFMVTRSRTIIKNQTLSLESGINDDSTNPNRGFYSFTRVFDVTLENIRLIPREYWHHDGTKVLHGTYGIGGQYVLNSTFKNVVSEGDDLHWGVFGTNLFKNFTIEKCKLNRVDVHFHCWNLHVKDSDIGYKGFTLTGGGDLIIENTRRHGNCFISFRNDYGARWDGNIFIDKCKLIQTDLTAEGRLLTFLPSDADYGYPIVLGENITIKDFIFDYYATSNNTADIWLIKMPKLGCFSENKDRIKFPENILCENIRVIGRDKGVNLIHWEKPNQFITTKRGKADPATGELVTNTTMKFVGVDTAYKTYDDFLNSKNFHICFSVCSHDNYMDDYAPIPKIIIEDCPYAAIQTKSTIADIYVTRCNVQSLRAYDSETDQKGRCRITVTNCDIRTEFSREITDSSGAFMLHTAYPVKLFGCTIHPPVVHGVISPQHFDSMYGEIVNISKHLVEHLHLGTLLSPAVTNYFGDKISQDLKDALQCKGDTATSLVLHTGGDVLPNAMELYRGKFFRLNGKPGEDDSIYLCKKCTDDSYEWILIA